MHSSLLQDNTNNDTVGSGMYGQTVLWSWRLGTLFFFLRHSMMIRFNCFGPQLAQSNSIEILCRYPRRIYIYDT